jgi:hypothetical protein
MLLVGSTPGSTPGSVPGSVAPDILPDGSTPGSAPGSTPGSFPTLFCPYMSTLPETNIVPDHIVMAARAKNSFVCISQSTFQYLIGIQVRLTKFNQNIERDSPYYGGNTLIFTPMQ